MENEEDLTIVDTTPKYCLNCLAKLNLYHTDYTDPIDTQVSVSFCSNACADSFMASLGKRKGLDILENQLNLKRAIMDLENEVKSFVDTSKQLQNTIDLQNARIKDLKSKYAFVCEKFELTKRGVD